MGQNCSDACALCDALCICWLKLSIPSTDFKMRWHSALQSFALCPSGHFRMMVSTPMGQNCSDACALCDAHGICLLKLSIPSNMNKLL